MQITQPNSNNQDKNSSFLLNNRTFHANRVNTSNAELIENEREKERTTTETFRTDHLYHGKAVFQSTIEIFNYIQGQLGENAHVIIDIEKNKIIVKHTIKEGSIEDIADKYIDIVAYFTKETLIKKIRSVNKLQTNKPEKGKKIIIPGIMQTTPSLMKARKIETGFSPKGIYLNASNVSDERILDHIKDLKASGCNMVIFDVKDDNGRIRFETRSDLARSIGAKRSLIPLHKIVYTLKKEKIHSAARISVFKDPFLARKRKDLRLKYKHRYGNGVQERDSWADPTMDEVVNYNLGLALELAKAGVDEINFDYIRFPGAKDIDTNGTNRVEVIASFLKKAHDLLKPSGVRISVDVYASVAWAKNGKTVKRIGQNLTEMAKYVDAIYIMAYPSHFYNIPGLENPTDHPHQIVKQTYEHAKQKLKDSNVQIVLFLQAFDYKNDKFPYGPKYIYEQLRAGCDSGSTAFLFWNRHNKYNDMFTGLKDFQKYIGSRRIGF